MVLPKKKSIAAALGLVLLAGCSQSPNVQRETAPSIQAESMQDAAESERLGTQWGDDVDSEVITVDLSRTNDNPLLEMQVAYADKNYQGQAVNSMSLLAGKVEFSVRTDNSKLPLYRDAGNYYLKGMAGQAYRLMYHNNSANTYEIVASVDGLNVLNGDAASRYDRGYVLEPNDDLVIEGFRKSQSAVASFIFSKPDNAYAANTSSGSIENTGVIGTVIYELYDPSEPKPRQAQAYPADKGYAKPPQ